jgi:hypothetical protein
MRANFNHPPHEKANRHRTGDLPNDFAPHRVQINRNRTADLPNDFDS